MIRQASFFSKFILLIIALQTANAQSPTPTPVPGQESTPEAEDIQMVEVNFTVFLWPLTGIQTSGAVLPAVPRTFYRDLKGHRQIRLKRGSSTELQYYKGPLPLVIYDLERVEVPPPPEAPPGTEPVITWKPVPMIRAEFPPAWKQVVLMVFPGKKAPDGTILTIPMPFEPEKLRPGFVRIYNATPQPLVLEVHDRKFTLPPFKNMDFRPENFAEGGYVRTTFWGKDDRGNLRMIYTRKIKVDEETNNYYFLYQRGERRIRLLRIAGHEDKPFPTPTPEPEVNR